MTGRGATADVAEDRAEAAAAGAAPDGGASCFRPRILDIRFPNTLIRHLGVGGVSVAACETIAHRTPTREPNDGARRGPTANQCGPGEPSERCAPRTMSRRSSVQPRSW